MHGQLVGKACVQAGQPDHRNVRPGTVRVDEAQRVARQRREERAVRRAVAGPDGPVDRSHALRQRLHVWAEHIDERLVEVVVRLEVEQRLAALGQIVALGQQPEEPAVPR